MKKEKKTGPKKGPKVVIMTIAEKRILVHDRDNFKNDLEKAEKTISEQNIIIHNERTAKEKSMDNCNDYQIEIEKIRKNILHRKIGIFFIGIGIGIILASIKF